MRKGGGGTLIFSNIRRPGPFLGLTFWYFVMTPKDIHKIFIPQKIFIFLKTLKGIEIQNFEPQNGASLRMSPDSNNRKKNSDKGVYCCFFATILYFLRFKRVETFIWGGGGVQLFINFFSGGGGEGVRTTYPSLDSRIGKKQVIANFPVTD